MWQLGDRILAFDKVEHDFPSVFIAAAMGRPSMVQVFIDSYTGRFAYYVGKSSLHQLFVDGPPGLFSPFEKICAAVQLCTLRWRENRYLTFIY